MRQGPDIASGYRFVRYQPYRGEDYGHRSMFGMGVLIVGESHYDFERCVDDEQGRGDGSTIQPKNCLSSSRKGRELVRIQILLAFGGVLQLRPTPTPECEGATIGQDVRRTGGRSGISRGPF